MSYEYIYFRDWLEAKQHYDIGYFDPIVSEPSLSDEILAALELTDTTLSPIMRCSGTECKLIFSFELTTEQETTVGSAVATHKANAAA